MRVIVTEDVFRFVRVMVCGVLELPSGTLPKFKDNGENSSGEARAVR